MKFVAKVVDYFTAKTALQRDLASKRHPMEHDEAWLALVNPDWDKFSWFKKRFRTKDFGLPICSFKTTEKKIANIRAGDLIEVDYIGDDVIDFHKIADGTEREREEHEQYVKEQIGYFWDERTFFNKLSNIIALAIFWLGVFTGTLVILRDGLWSSVVVITLSAVMFFGRLDELMMAKRHQQNQVDTWRKLTRQNQDFIRF